LNNPIYYVDPDGQDVTPGSTFMAVKQLYGAYQVFSQTDVFKQITEAFSVDSKENLKFIYHANNSNIASASAGYYPTNSENTNYTHVVQFYSLDVFVPGEGGVITRAEKTYDGAFIAGVLAHEIIHNNMDRYFEAELSITELDKNFPGISTYIERFANSEVAQHEYMAANSRSLIADAMRQTDMKQSTPLREDKWYDAASWNGLTHHEDGTETEAWTNFKKNATTEEIEYVEKVLTSPEVVGEPKPKADE
jgi:hypothetical protein